MANKFSGQLQELKNSDKPITLQVIIDNFKDKSFAILFLLLMAVPALPLPTGGLTHIFEIVAMLLAVELIIGRRSVWLPNKWLKLSLPTKFWSATLPRLVKYVKKIEKISKPRLSDLMVNAWFDRIIGVFIFVFTLSAFLSPPFSGLDTLPALGVVIISLGLIFEDIIIGAAGILVGLTGIVILAALGRVVFRLF